SALDGQAATLIPAQSGSALAAILPEPLRSPQLTAQWEWSLQKIEDGLLEPEAFLSEVQEMVTGLVSGFTPVEDAEYLFPSNRPVVGTCPRCGRERSEEHTSGLQSRFDLVCRLLLEKRHVPRALGRRREAR